MRRVLFGLVLACVSSLACAATAVAPEGVTLEGRWKANTTLSDDGEAWLAKRMEEMREDQRRFEERRRKQLENDPFAWEPEFTPPADTPQFRARMEERDRSIRQSMGMTNFLSIAQGERGSKLTLVSDFETRRLEAGARSQISMPQGQLADLRSGWERDVFVIERRSRDGPSITERYRVLKTDQLEVLTQIKGRSMLSGLKLRRVFDRSAGEPPPRDPAAGPVR